MTQRTLTLLRGLPGSGKSRYVKENYDLSEVVVCSSDDHFTDATGAYDFVPMEIGDAHKECFVKALSACAKGDKDVIIDNTNVHMWEASPYIMVANSFDMNIEIIHVLCPAELAADRNIHEVPREIIDQMDEEWEAFPPFWPEECLVEMFTP